MALTRDWIFVEDNCSAIDLIFNCAKSGEEYNIASGNELTNLELVNLISEIMLIDYKINFVSDRLGHDFRYSLNTEKIKKDLGWFPTNEFKISLKNYINQQINKK